MDYAALLEKYMRHVCQCEGDDFVDHIGCSFAGAEVEFTEHEKMALKAASVRVAENPWAKHPVDVMHAMCPDVEKVSPERVAQLRAVCDAPAEPPKEPDANR